MSGGTGEFVCSAEDKTERALLAVTGSGTIAEERMDKAFGLPYVGLGRIGATRLSESVV